MRPARSARTRPRRFDCRWCTRRCSAAADGCRSARASSRYAAAGCARRYTGVRVALARPFCRSRTGPCRSLELRAVHLFCLLRLHRLICLLRPLSLCLLRPPASSIPSHSMTNEPAGCCSMYWAGSGAADSIIGGRPWDTRCWYSCMASAWQKQETCKSFLTLHEGCVDAYIRSETLVPLSPPAGA